MKKKIVSVKFCGQCKPQISINRLFKNLKKEMEDIDVEYYIHQPDGDVLVVLNACPAVCAAVPPFEGPIIIAGSHYVQDRPVDEDDALKVLKEEVMQALNTTDT